MKDAAEESPQVKRARRKLLKQVKKEEAKITPKSLQKSGDSVRRWIARHATERVDLKDKTFRLFDENKHTVETRSDYVNKLQKRVQASLRTGELFQRPAEPEEMDEEPGAEGEQDNPTL